MNKRIKTIPNSADAYARLKPITDAAQAGTLNPWGAPIVELLSAYGIKVDRKEGMRLQTNLSFPTSKENRSIAIGIRHMKPDNSFAEDLFVFEEDSGLTCYYRGSQEDELPEYAGSHHAKIVLTEFLPEMKQDIESLKERMTQLGSQPIPEFHLQLYGSGATSTFRGHVEKKSDITLVLTSVKIGEIKTELNRQFTKLTHLNDILNFNPSLFEDKQPDIKIIVRYRNLTGETFEYSVDATQQFRQGDGRYNVVVSSTPVIKRVVELSSEEQELIDEANKNNGQLHYMSTDQVPSGWIRVGGRDFYYEDNYAKTHSYVKALRNLVQLGKVEHASGKLYLLNV